jgi:hypothetical protein
MGALLPPFLPNQPLFTVFFGRESKKIGIVREKGTLGALFLVKWQSENSLFSPDPDLNQAKFLGREIVVRCV